MYSLMDRLDPGSQVTTVSQYQVSDRSIVIESTLLSSLPGGMLVTSCILSLPDNPLQELPVVLHNESNHNIIIPARSVIAEIHALHEVISNQQDPTDTAHSDCIKPAENVKLNFDGSPLPAEWRERTEQKLCTVPEVFTLHDSDFG